LFSRAAAVRAEAIILGAIDHRQTLACVPELVNNTVMSMQSDAPRAGAFGLSQVDGLVAATGCVAQFLDDMLPCRAESTLGFGNDSLDVTNPEPLPNPHPLRNRGNVIITPHAAWYSEQAMGGMQAGAPVEVRRVLTGSGPLTS
jgi:hypothetical protein